MSEIQVGSAIISNWQDRRTSVELWVFCNSAFVASDGTLIPSGSLDDKVVYVKVPCAVNTSTKTITINSFSIQSTLDGQDIQSAAYSAFFVTTRGAEIKAHLAQFRIAASPSLINWEDIILYQVDRANIFVNNNSFTKDQSDIRYALASVVLNAVQANVENTFTQRQTFDQNGQSLIWDGNSIDTTADNNTGAAPLLLEPRFFRLSGSSYRSVGMFVRPTFGSTTGAEGVFFAPYNLWMGTPGTPIPAGTKGNPCGYIANMFTDQAFADMDEALEAYGATIGGSGGAPLRGSSIFIRATDVAANIVGHNLSIQTDVSGGSEYGHIVDSTGSPAVPTGGWGLIGTWKYGLDLAGAGFTSGGVRLPNLTAILWRNQANDADVVGMILDGDNNLQVGANLINGGLDAFFQLGSSVNGYVLQKVDSTGRFRITRQGVGSLFELDSNPSSGNAGLLLWVNNGSLVQKQVSLGAADSGGSGFKVLRVTN